MFSIVKKFCSYATRKKSFSKSQSLNTRLDRTLSTFHLIFFGISHMIGAGIYILTGHLIKERVGPATNISFFLSGIASIFTGLCYCEFATLIPKAGSCYTYTYVIMGEMAAFTVGWTMIMDVIISLASISKGFSGALNLLANDAIRNFTDKYLPLARNSNTWDSSIDLIAVLLLFILFLVSLTGTAISMNINSILAILELCFLIVTIVSCFIYGTKENYTADGGYLPFGVTSIFQGAGIAIFAYSGFECLANAAEETKEPKKSIPFALLTSLSIIICLYVLASSGLSYLVPRLKIDENAPFIAGFQNKNLIPFKWVTGIGTLLATGATKLTTIYVLPRMIFAMAEDGLLFKVFAHLHPKTKVPIYGLICGMVLSMLLAMFIKLQILADVTSMGIIISFIVIGLDLLILRYLYFKENFLEMRIYTHPIFTNKKCFIIILLCLIFSVFLMGLFLIFDFHISQSAGITCLIITIVLVCIFTCILALYKPYTAHESFMTPIMPVAPVISITLNICLLINLPGDTWIRFIVWIFIGLLIYIFYGIRNSNLTVIDDETSELLKVENRTLKEKNVNTETKETTENSENQQNPEKTENLEKTENFENPEKTENLDNPEKTEKTEKTDEMY